MATNKAWCTGTNALMDWFNENAETPYYSVWRGRNLSFSWNNDDIEAGRNKLQNDINFAEQNNVTEVLTIKLHPKKDKLFITDKSPVYASLDFRPCQLEQPVYQIGAYNGGGNSHNYAMDKIMDKLNMLESRLSAQEEYEEIDEKPQSPIHSMLANPQVQEALISGLLGMVGNMLNGGKPMSGVAGIGNVTDEAIEILDSLMKKGINIEHLKKLNAMTDSKLQNLLIML